MAPAEAAGTDGGLLAFSYTDLVGPQPSSVGTIGPDGTGEALVATNLPADQMPSISHDGRQIAFTRDTSDGSDPLADVFVEDLVSGQVRRITSGLGAGFPVWSPDDTELAFVSNGMGTITGPGLYVVAAAGGSPRFIAANATRRSGWSPDGSRLIFTTGIDVWTIAPDGTGALSVDPAIAGPTVISGLAWAADGQRYFFCDGYGSAWSAAADGSDVRSVVARSAAGDAVDMGGCVVPSPDGQSIAYSWIENVPGGTGAVDLYIAGVDGSSPQRLTNGAAQHWYRYPSWGGGAISTPVPAVDCDPAPTEWQAANVTIACRASATPPAALADPADASFSLSTAVAAGDETASASTDAHQVCDTNGACVTAGPIAGIAVDLKDPVVAITSPADGATLTEGQAVAAAYDCSDGGSGVESCVGSVASGSDLNTATVGIHTFTVVASDVVGHQTTVSVTYTVLPAATRRRRA